VTAQLTLGYLWVRCANSPPGGEWLREPARFRPPPSLASLTRAVEVSRYAPADLRVDRLEQGRTLTKELGEVRMRWRPPDQVGPVRRASWA